MHRPHTAGRGPSRPPSAPPNAGTKRKERDYEQDSIDETNINVVVRCRGRSDREVKENSGVVVSTGGVKGKTVELSMGPNAISNKTYQFDKVFSPAADQTIIFEDVVSPILNDMLGGFNCTIFAYGQTGTGKTYTMSGDMTDTFGLLSDAAGIIPRVLYALFQKLEAEGTECAVKCSFIELYNEELRDLLSADDNVKLKIYEDAGKKGHTVTIVQGMEESHIQSAAAGIKLLQAGSHRRQVAATKCNDLSSRSHTVFTITTYTKKPGDGDDYVCSGKLNLVDLAGSENIQRSGAENKRAAEAGLINKSLLTLGRVINALVDKSAHIPYRESKLTRLLQDSLGGRTKTCIIATVSPAKSNLEETISTLDYAFRAKNIRNKPQVNSMIKKTTLLKELTAEIEKIKSELIATRQRNGVYLTNDQFEEMTVESESRRILSEEQRARIETMELSLRSKVQELFNLTNTFVQLKKDHETARVALDSTKDILETTEALLDHTKRVLEEESALRQKYASTEERLHSIGGELISTVGGSLRDLDRVHAKLRRRSDLHSGNRMRWRDLTTTTAVTVSSVDARIHDLQRQHEEMLRSLNSRIQSYLAEEVRKTLQGKAALQQTLSSLTGQTEEIESLSFAAKDEMNDVLEEIKVLRADVKGKVGEGLHGLSEAAARISGEVITELDQFHTQLHGSYRGLGQEFKNMFDDLTKQLVEQRDEAGRLRTALQAANEKNTRVSTRTADELQTYLDAEREAAEADKRELMQQISSLMSDRDKRREQRLAKAVSHSQSSLSEAGEELKVANEFYRRGMDRWMAQEDALLDNVTNAREELKAKVKKDWSAVENRNSAIQASTKAVHEETVKIVDAQLETMATQMEALDEFVTRARQRNDEHHEANVTNLANLSSDVKGDLAALEVQFDTSALVKLKSDTSVRIGEWSEKFESLTSETRAPLEQLNQQAKESSMQEYIPTGETPQRREWSYPVELPSTIEPVIAVSTTPTISPSKARTPGRSPQKRSSPQKALSSPRKQPVHVDTPPTKIPRTEPARPNVGSLRAIDLNVAPTSTACHSAPDSTVSTADVHEVKLSKFKIPINPASSLIRNAIKMEAAGNVDVQDKLQKENIRAVNSNDTNHKLNRHLHGTGTAAATTTTTSTSTSMSTFGGGEAGVRSVNGRVLRSSASKKSPPDLPRTLSE